MKLLLSAIIALASTHYAGAQTIAPQDFEGRYEAKCLTSENRPFTGRYEVIYDSSNNALYGIKDGENYKAFEFKYIGKGAVTLKGRDETGCNKTTYLTSLSKNNIIQKIDYKGYLGCSPIPTMRTREVNELVKLSYGKVEYKYLYDGYGYVCSMKRI